MSCFVKEMSRMNLAPVPRRSCLQVGHRFCGPIAIALRRHFLQKLCPQLVVQGRMQIAKHTGHSRASSSDVERSLLFSKGARAIFNFDYFLIHVAL